MKPHTLDDLNRVWKFNGEKADALFDALDVTRNNMRVLLERAEAAEARLESAAREAWDAGAEDGRRREADRHTTLFERDRGLTCHASQQRDADVARILKGGGK